MVPLAVSPASVRNREDLALHTRSQSLERPLSLAVAE